MTAKAAVAKIVAKVKEKVDTDKLVADREAFNRAMNGPFPSLRGFNYCCGASEVQAQDRSTEQFLAARVLINGGYGVATTVCDQIAEVRNLKAAGFTELAKFYNPNSGRKVTLWGATKLKKSDIDLI